MTQEQKAEQAWDKLREPMTDVVAFAHKNGCLDFKSSLKREIEKDKTLDILNENDPYDRGWIAACKHFLELLNTVEP